MDGNLGIESDGNYGHSLFFSHRPPCQHVLGGILSSNLPSTGSYSPFRE